MDIQRAQEIMDTFHLTHVNYRGIPVYLQKIHSDQETATVFPLDNIDHEQIVDIAGLSE